ncbi:bifunctional diaminohydroxyphosphoribosylaminopyrimidine deaminase/5-amino-6-(5-phosphoribosylamino)uracil reductase RibD [Thermosulfuriphilus sp.]
MDVFFMKKALSLGHRGLGRTSPNPPVGAVVVKEGRIIGRGYHQRAGEPHAEIHALREAGPEAQGATIYVTLEPCNHYGKTPPCTQAILKAGIRRVVVGLRDPNPKAAGGLEFLRAQGLEVKSGILAEECLRLVRFFVRSVTSGRPWILAKIAQSLDGRIATHTGDSKWITTQETRRHAHRLRNIFDAILVGIGTILADNPRLTCRLPQGRDPHRIILDSHLRTPQEARILNLTSSARTIIICGPEAPAEKEAALRAKGAEVIRVKGSREKGLDLPEILDHLRQRGIISVLVEGGARIHGSFFDAGLVDEIAFYYGPMIIGGQRAPGGVSGQGVPRVTEATRIYDLRLRRLGDDILLKGYTFSFARWLSDLSLDDSP